MNEEQLKTYLEQRRIIRTFGVPSSGFMFWKNKDDGYDIEINGRMRLTADRYIIEEDGTLSFQIKGETIFRTETKTEDMTYLDEIIGRVFEFKGGHAWLFAFAVGFDMYDCMYWDEDGESEHRRYPAEQMYKMWHDNKMVGQSTAEMCMETLGEFIKQKVVDI